MEKKRKCSDAFLSQFNLTEGKCNVLAVCSGACFFGLMCSLLLWLDKFHVVLGSTVNFLTSLMYLMVGFMLAALGMYMLTWYVRFLASSKELS